MTPPASREVVEGHLAKIAEMLHRPRVPKPEAEAVVKLRAQVPMLRDVGHGDKCTCEVCWRERFPPRPDVVPVPEHAGLTPGGDAAQDVADSREVASRYEQLRAQFPPEEGA